MKLLFNGPRQATSIVAPGRVVYNFIQGKTTEVKPEHVSFLLKSVMHRFEVVVEEPKRFGGKNPLPKPKERVEEPKKKRGRRKKDK